MTFSDGMCQQNSDEFKEGRALLVRFEEFKISMKEVTTAVVEIER